MTDSDAKQRELANATGSGWVLRAGSALVTDITIWCGCRSRNLNAIGELADTISVRRQSQMQDQLSLLCNRHDWIKSVGFYNRVQDSHEHMMLL